ncbi:uncharacterized protein LOC134253485 [Saccostrea cucullata]|uniref:uncharacterized protein LOC134253485 n=1 Tax=Saccostrea cuccullata TaxID=36930 RepID=UPI002ED50239
MSQSNTVSEVPDEIIFHQDEHFIEEITTLNGLYFGNQSEFVPLSSSEDEEEERSTNCTGDISDSDTELELRSVDIDDEKCVEEFKSKTCGCSKLYGVPCSTKVEFSHILEYRQQCQEMSNEELDLTVKVQLAAHRKSSTYWPQSMSKKQKTKDRERVAQKYYFAGQQVCRDTFLFCHSIGKFKLNNIASSLDKDGLKPRIHGNTGKMPKHALIVTDVKRVCQFLEEYTMKNGLPLPGRQPNYSTQGNKVLLLLPSDKTKSDVWELYNQAAVMQNYRKVSLSEFKKIWLEQMPHILIMKPATDLCPKCQRYVHNITNAGNLSEDEKKTMLEEYTCHLDRAKEQKEYYRERCLQSKDLYHTHNLDQAERGQVCTHDVTQTYSFDFAQQVHYPHHAQEVGPLFFKTPRKCQAFGVCAEGAGVQRFYLVDEAEEVGKGANTVVSLLHHYFELWGC